MIALIKNFAYIKIAIKSFKYSNCTFSCVTEPHHPAL